MRASPVLGQVPIPPVPDLRGDGVGDRRDATLGSRQRRVGVSPTAKDRTGVTPNQAGLNPQAVEAFAFAPTDPNVAYAGLGAFFTPSYFDESLPGGGIYRSDDGGKTWQTVNDNLSEMRT